MCRSSDCGRSVSNLVAVCSTSQSYHLGLSEPSERINAERERRPVHLNLTLTSTAHFNCPLDCHWTGTVQIDSTHSYTVTTTRLPPMRPLVYSLANLLPLALLLLLPSNTTAAPVAIITAGPSFTQDTWGDIKQGTWSVHLLRPPLHDHSHRCPQADRALLVRCY